MYLKMNMCKETKLLHVYLHSSLKLRPNLLIHSDQPKRRPELFKTDKLIYFSLKVLTFVIY